MLEILSRTDEQIVPYCFPKSLLKFPILLAIYENKLPTNPPTITIVCYSFLSPTPSLYVGKLCITASVHQILQSQAFNENLVT